MADQHIYEGKERRLPDFLCIGGQRSGTTWLHRHLNSHPEIWLPPVKEIHYFSGRDVKRKRKINVYLRHLRVRVIDNISDIFSLNKSLPQKLAWDMRYFFGKRNTAWFLSLFRPLSHQIAGESSPYYAVLLEDIVKEIHNINPDMKIIYIMRNPIERSWSGAIKDLARQNRRNINEVPENEILKKINTPGTLDRSNHLKVIEKWETFFRKEQIFIAFFEEVIDQPEELLKRILQFLGVSSSSEFILPDIAKKVNSSGKYYSPIPAHLHVHMAEQQIDQLRELSMRFGGPAKKWLNSAEEILAGSQG